MTKKLANNELHSIILSLTQSRPFHSITNLQAC